MALPFPHPPDLSPQFTVSRCTPADVPEIVSCYLAAFSQTDFDYFWPPSLDAMRAWTEVRFRQKFTEPMEQQFKVVDGETGKLVAYARWNIPTGMKGMAVGFETYEAADEGGSGGFTGPEGKCRQPLPEGADPELFREFFAGIKQMSVKWGAKDKLGLSLICTDPAYHRRGIAKGLIDGPLAIADAEGFPAYLEALSSAAAMYKNKFGFQEVDRLEYDMSKAGREGKALLNIMIREPNPACLMLA